MYCGDETGAFIGDVGAHTSRFGYGGEDCPKVVVPSAVYSRPDGADRSDGDAFNGKVKYSAPVSLMRVPPEDCFSPPPSVGGGNDAEGGDGNEHKDGAKTSVGFLPIYQSLNSNNPRASDGNDISADDGVISDIDAWAATWEYSYRALCVRGRGKHTIGHKRDAPELQPEGGGGADGPIDHPLLAVDSTCRTLPPKAREAQRALMLEAMFESLSAPAAYVAPTSMLSSFAYGRQTALVVDVGHSGCRVTPLVDGYCLDGGSVASGRGGRWLGDVQRSVLAGTRIGRGDADGGVASGWNGWGKGNAPPCQDEGVLPRYLLHGSTRECPVERLGALKRSPFHDMCVHEVMHEMMTSPHIVPLDRSNLGISTVPFCGYNENEGDDSGGDGIEDGPSYMLPDGTRVDVGKSSAGRDLCRLPELLFSETLPPFIQPSNADKNAYATSMLPLQKLVHKSLTDILDVDLRKELSSNIIVTGGASLFPTLDKRLSVELGKVLPHSHKYKVIASKNSVENRYSAWIGGSILSSLGSFQQLWLSKKEYEEYGPLLGQQRFKN